MKWHEYQIYLLQQRTRDVKSMEQSPLGAGTYHTARRRAVVQLLCTMGMGPKHKTKRSTAHLPQTLVVGRLWGRNII